MSLPSPSIDATTDAGENVVPADGDRCPDTGLGRLSHQMAWKLFSQASGGSALTHLGEEGVSAILLQAKSRHQDPRTLSRYAKPGIEAVAALTAEFDRGRRQTPAAPAAIAADAQGDVSASVSRGRMGSVSKRTPFAGGDQTYLREVQYGDGSRLDVRSALHQRYLTSPVAFPDFEAGLIDWQPDLTVLECGTGTGRFWDNTCAPRSVSITLTDLSPGMVAEATGRASGNGFHHVQGQECDVQALPYEDATFDLAIANHMLYHVPDPDRALLELARVLRPNGVLLAATNGSGHMREINDAITEVFGSHGEGLADVFGIDTGEARLREHFRSITWHAYDNDLVVDSPTAAIDYGLSFPPGEAATDAQADAFAAAITRRFVDGILRIRTRSGAFVCTGTRQQPEVAWRR